jgi:hypothetical protein
MARVLNGPNGALPKGERITVRFDEWERYDPMTDTERVRFMAVTNFGTYHAEVEIGGAKSVRFQRERFRDRALECMSLGMLPGEVDIGEH